LVVFFGNLAREKITEKTVVVGSHRSPVPPAGYMTRTSAALG
jgi:hypothetical protein